jgi:hypothetical protein
MPRFTFSLFDGDTVAHTSTEEFAGVREAGARALRLVADHIQADDQAWALQEWRVDVSDPDGLILITIGAYGREAAALKASR